MTKLQKISAKMVPAFEATASASMVGDISLVPALRVRLTVGQENLKTIGVIDTASEFSMIDLALFKTLSTRPTQGVRVSLSTGKARKQLLMYHLDVSISGDGEDQELHFRKIPVVVSSLDRKVFIIGRRGLLDRLRVDLDFPRHRVNLSLERSSNPTYPSLSNELLNLDSIVQSFDSGSLAQATMMIAWELESFADRIIQEDPILRTHIKAKRRSEMTLGEKLREICRLNRLLDLADDIDQFTSARNAAAHASSTDVSKISRDKVLHAAETIVSRLSKSYSDEKSPMTYQYYKDARGEWRWQLTAADGRIIAGSGEGYKTRQECLDDINRVRGQSAASVVKL